MNALTGQFISAVFKKIDSTLKGNWQWEVLAMLDELTDRTALIAPAFPATGRCIVDGKLHLNRSDQVSPYSLLDALHKESGSLPYHVSRNELRIGPQHLAHQVLQRSGNERLVVVDSETDADLDIVAEALELLRDRALPVGSAGLSASMARVAKRSTRLPGSGDCDWEIPLNGSRAVVLFAGSENPRTVAQVKFVAADETTAEFELASAPMQQVTKSLERGLSIVFWVRWNERERGVIREVLESCRLAGNVGFVLTGGDTAHFVCQQIAANGIWLEGELAAGLPWGRICGGPFDRSLVATKAGGFGEPDTLLRIVKFLSGKASTSVFRTNLEF